VALNTKTNQMEKTKMNSRIKTLLAILSMVVILVGCSSGPSDTAKEFLSRIASGEISKANELATESTAKLIGIASSFGGLPVDPDFDFQLIEEKIDGNKATVKYKSKPNGKVEVIKLVKLNGKWKVHEQKR
jgi:hypothetical protein